MEFDIDGQVLFSGDQAGAIRVWESSSTDHWYLKKSLDFREIQGNPIMALSIHDPKSTLTKFEVTPVTKFSTLLRIPWSGDESDGREPLLYGLDTTV